MASKPDEISGDTKTILVILLLVFFYPLGLLFMWFWMQWPLWLKVLLTVLPVVFFIIVLSIFGAVLLALISFADKKGDFIPEYERRFVPPTVSPTPLFK